MTRGIYKRHIAICPYCQRIVVAKEPSDRQWEVVKRLIGGVPTAQIAEELFVSIKTVESHIAKIMEILNISGRGGERTAKLIRWANDQGLLHFMGWDESRPSSKE